MITRQITSKIETLTSKFPIITLTGPRQSGKSTLLRKCFPTYRYVSLENIDIRNFAASDPNGFIKTYPDHVIIDEAQLVPELFSYLQTHVDTTEREGMYFLSGSNNFMMMQRIGQSLAGRTVLLTLLPFSHREMKEGGILPATTGEEIYKGGYPRLYDKDISPTDYYPSYIQTYVERDIRLLKNISNLDKFTRFVKLCAGRIGQLLNLASLANECGIAVSTANEWLSLLETSYICYVLRPDHNNFAKRLVKTPKLYFYDTGLACSLLQITSAEQLSTHFLRGGLFENLVINEFIKSSYNRGEIPDLCFWRDSAGTEIDLISYTNGIPHAYEIKSASTFSPGFFKNLTKWAKLAGVEPDRCSVIYDGDTSMATTQGEIIGWRTLDI